MNSRRCISVVVHCLPLAIALLLCSLGCSRFEKDWRAAASGSNGSPSLAGRWQGTWKSDGNGHTDELRCLITPIAEGRFSARYHARYRRGLFRFTFQYTVPLAVRQSADGWTFSGEADLGWMAGGNYRYSGRATAEEFHSTYDARYDRGVFVLRRVPAEP